MFAVRGLAVSFSMFVLAYGVLSCAVSWGWKPVWLRIRRLSARRCADLLFLLRVFPFAASVAVTAALAVPSFLLLEPRTIHEPLGIVPALLGLCGLFLLLLGALKAAAALASASHAIAEWSGDALLVSGEDSVPVLRINRALPALTAAGILRPRVLVSQSAEIVLTGREMGTALRHEFAHVSQRDNLKKLVLRFIVFPGMAGLETAWLDASEMAADDAAVSSASEALDLAAALIKLSQMAPLPMEVQLTTCLVRSPLASVNARIARLLEWKGGPQNDARNRTGRFSASPALVPALAAAFALVGSYNHLLLGTHEITEWLMK